ncbi:MAG: hypothetical protein QXT22_04940, partial [Candidatus Hadarchaeales archaeon]
VYDDNWHVAPALPDGIYYWRVRAKDNATNVLNWNSVPIRSFRVDTTPPTAPTPIWPVSDVWTKTAPTMIWTSVEENSEPVMYYVEISSENWGPVARSSGWIYDNNWVVSPPLTQGYYYWRLKARDNAGNESIYSNIPGFRVDATLPPQTTLASPENMRAFDHGTTVRLVWDPVIDIPSGTENYWIQIATSPDFTTRIVDENQPAPDTDYDYVFPALGVYYWRVKAIDRAGNEGAWSEARTIRIVRWTLIESWTSTITAKTYIDWFVVESWSGTFTTITTWQVVETWTSTIATTAQWQLAESWQTTITTTATWQLAESWTATITTSAQWELAESWSATITTTAGWQLAETWQAIITTSAQWQLAESWTGTVTTTADWQLAETWQAIITTSAQWELAESWTSTITAKPYLGWFVTENWTLTINAPIPAPVLVSPPNGTNTNNPRPIFDWDNLQPADSFRFQLDNDSDFSSPVYNLVIGGTQSWFQPAIDLPDGLYYWRVKMYRDNDDNPDTPSPESPWSENWTINIDHTAPQSPSPLSPIPGENIKNTTPTIKWENVTQQVNGTPELSLPLTYYVAVSDNPNFPYENRNSGWISENTWTVTPALSDGIWYWRARAKDNVGNESDNSPTWSFRVDTIAPSPPQQISPEPSTYTKDTPTFKWYSVTNENSFPIMYHVEIWALGFKQTESPWIYENQWTCPPGYLSEGTTYSWKVQARDNALNVGAFSTEWTFWVDITPPSKPALYKPSGTISSSLVTFEWQKSTDTLSGVARYWIQIDNEPSFDSTYFVHENQYVKGTENTYQLTLPDGLYYWRVKAIDNAGNESLWADNFSFRVDTLPPQGVALSYPENNKIYPDNTPDLYWWKGSDNSTPIYYRVVVSLYENFQENV